MLLKIDKEYEKNFANSKIKPSYLELQPLSIKHLSGTHCIKNIFIAEASGGVACAISALNDIIALMDSYGNEN